MEQHDHPYLEDTVIPEEGRRSERVPAELRLTQKDWEAVDRYIDSLRSGRNPDYQLVTYLASRVSTVDSERRTELNDGEKKYLEESLAAAREKEKRGNGWELSQAAGTIALIYPERRLDLSSEEWRTMQGEMEYWFQDGNISNFLRVASAMRVIDPEHVLLLPTGYREVVEEQIRKDRDEEGYFASADLASEMRLCDSSWKPEIDERDQESFLQDVRLEILWGEWHRAIPSLADLRILFAHEVKITPGKGVEIIDDPPQEFESTKSQLPETRKF